MLHLYFCSVIAMNLSVKKMCFPEVMFCEANEGRDIPHRSSDRFIAWLAQTRRLEQPTRSSRITGDAFYDATCGGKLHGFLVTHVDDVLGCSGTLVEEVMEQVQELSTVNGASASVGAQLLIMQSTYHQRPWRGSSPFSSTTTVNGNLRMKQKEES